MEIQEGIVAQYFRYYVGSFNAPYVVEDFQDYGLIEFDLSNIGTFDQDTMQATLRLTISDYSKKYFWGDMGSEEPLCDSDDPPPSACYKIYTSAEQYENGIIEKVDVPYSQSPIAEFCVSSATQPGDMVSVDVTSAVANDLFSADQTDFSGFYIWKPVSDCGILKFYDHTDTANAPILSITGATLIELADFTAAAKSGGVALHWVTETEIRNAGFNIYRAESADGAYIKINNGLIPAEGSATQGNTYTYNDRDLQNRKTYYYKLEDIDLNGTATMHGPVSAKPRLLFGLF